MKPQKTLTGLYLITNDDHFDDLAQKIHLVTAFGCVAAIQYRRKLVDKVTQLTEAAYLQELCLGKGIHFIVNDDMHLAEYLKPFGACGVHLGQQDGSITEARKRLGNSAIIGRTCHQSLELAHQAEQEGANYVAFGAYRPSISKPNVKTVSQQLLSQAVVSLNTPVCVIGGIKANDAPQIKSLGVNLIAVIHDVMSGTIEQVEQKMVTWQSNLDAT